MEKSQKVTFESLNNKDLEFYLDNKGLELVNKYYWKNENFHLIYFSRKNHFSTDESELKDEYEKWHREIGTLYFNPDLKKFVVDILPFRQRLKAANEIAKFVNYHPLLTIKDQKNLNLIKKEISDKYFRNSVFNTFMGIMVILAFSRNQAASEKKPLALIIKKNYFLSISLLFISFLVLDYSFRLRKYKIFLDSLSEKNMTERYFANYL
jgi:hypothetical protein